MHSSRMRIGGGCLSRGVSAQGGFCQGEVSAWGCVYWGCLPRGWVSATPHSVHAVIHTPLPAQCMLGYTHHLWTEFLTHFCENITFPQLNKCITSYEIGFAGPMRSFSTFNFIHNNQNKAAYFLINEACSYVFS